MLLLLFPIAMGAGLAMQTAVNAKLRDFVLSPYLSSGFSFLMAWVFLLLLNLVTRQPLLISGTFITHNPSWLWLGGFFGAIALTGNVVLFQKIGSLQTTVLPIMGQIIMSILIDQFGLFQSPANPLTWAKGIGLVLIVSGVILSLGLFEPRDPLLKAAERHAGKGSQLFYQLFAILAGMLMAMQTAINGYLGTTLHSPIRASFISFTIGVLSLILVNLITHAHFSNIRLALKQGPRYWWIWIGGIIGALYVLCSSWLVPLIGTGQVVVLALFGQLVFSALVENFGLFASQVNRMTRAKIIGLVVMFVGVLTVKFITF
ncbi:DMT family transporter [Levilactobacillus paucivorans]|nr:DMT family transporter [Levilactobacillus paucivorans]